MKRFVLVPIAAALAACSTNEPVTPAPAPVVLAPAPVVTAPPPTVAVVPSASAGGTVIVPQTPAPLRVGIGHVDSITAVPSGPSDMRRVGVKMADNTIQYMDGRVPNLSLGDRVEITSDGHLKYPAP